MLSCTAPSSLLGKGGAWENRGGASMKTRAPLLGNASSFLLPIATALCAAAIFAGDIAGAEEQFGWTREEALGKISHQLLETSFPAPLDQIRAELLRTGRWEGEFVHRKRDGERVV